MSTAIALMFLAEAATTCPPVDPRLRAGASVVQAIVSVEPKVLDPVAPKPAAADDATGSGEAGSTADTEEPDAGPPAEECKATPPPIA